MKLREQCPGHPHLIQYERPNRLDQRESRYRIVDVHEGDVLKDLLGAALGVLGMVVKRRRLFVWQAVRIHLDEVEQLGTFIEFEAVVAAGSDLAHERKLVSKLHAAFGITAECLIASGYADQLFTRS